MSETVYSIENAKSGRSSCKKCKVKIAKGEIRLGVEADGASFRLQSWYHPECFPFPRKLTKEGITVETFVEDMLEDNTDENILGSDAEDIIEKIKTKPAASSKKPKSEGSEGAAPGGNADRVAIIKLNLQRMREEAMEDEGEESRPKKKMKKEGKKKIKGDLTDLERAEAEVYAAYEKRKNDELKDVLRWNKQMIGGNKDALISRIIDGQLNGRLGMCPSCEKGRMKLKEEDGGESAYCNGYFDEDQQARIPCFYVCPVKEAPRLHPWFSEEPTDEEKEKMKASEENARNKSSGAGDDSKSKLKALASKLKWDLSSKAGIKAAAKDMTEMCAKDHLVDLPDDKLTARMEIGKIIVQNRTRTAEDIVELVVDRFGLTKVKAEKEKKQGEALSVVCGHPANAAVMQAILELGDLYFKESNRNAGATYKKVAQAIKDLKFEITSDNAKGLGKGKTKVAGIGKGSAEKLYEFVTTGIIEKLEEKRASAQ